MVKLESLSNSSIEKTVNYFNIFLNINNFNCIPLCKQRKFNFLYNEIILNKNLFTMDYQLCSTALAKKYLVTPITISSWIKDLLRINIINCVSNNYKIGYKSKEYRINLDSEYIPKINELNLFNKSNFQAQALINRKSLLVKLKGLNLSNQDMLKIAKRYAVPGFESFMEDIIENYPSCFLYSPSFNNVRVIRLYDFYKAFKLAAEQYNYMVISKSKSIKIDKTQLVNIPQFKKTKYYNEKAYINSRDKLDIKHLNNLILTFTKAKNDIAVEQLNLIKCFTYNKPYITFKHLGIDELAHIKGNPLKYPKAFI